MEVSKAFFESTSLEDIEEEVKNKIIVPYLQQLGFSPAELSFEKTLPLRMGRWKKNIQEEPIKTVKGRLDILCKRNDVNMFLIEVKRSGSKLTDDDREQGINYARNLDQIPPFVVVTNGQETKVYDTITKNELTNASNIGDESNYFKNGFRLATEQDIKIRYDALKKFIGYSPENLHYFCSVQQSDRMLTLKGDVNELDKKYIPSLYVNRRNIFEEFKKFLGDPNACCFAIVGESGAGKTNIICALAESNQEENLSLFFNAPDLAKGIWTGISDDFNWQFSAEKSEIQLIKDLEGLLSKTNQYICIFVDAMDEATESFALELDDFIAKVSKKRFKIIITCKDTEWGRFLKRLGNPTFLSQNIYKASDHYEACNEKTKESVDKQPGILLKAFNEDELREAEQKYREIYHFRGNLSGPLRNQCRLPFMLRVVAEVYQDSNTDLPYDVNHIHLLKKYLEKKLEKMESYKALRFLECIGGIFLEENITDSTWHEFSGKTSEEIIRSKLGIPLSEDIYTPLFSHGILTRSRDKLGREYVGFYYSEVRDFIIAIHCLKLDTLSDDALKNILPSLFRTSTGQSAAYWYYNASQSLAHKRILDEYLEIRIANFVKNYNEIIDTHFYNFKDRFVPYTNGEIGLIISKKDHILSYAFRSISSDNDELVKSVPNLQELWDSSPERIGELGVLGYMYQRGIDFFFSINAQEEALKYVQKQLEAIVKNGNLNESDNFSICLEKILVILDFWGEEMQYKKFRNKLRGRNKFLPIDCSEFTNLIKLDYARCYYTEQMREDKIRKTGITATSWDSKDYEIIEEKAYKAFQEGVEFPRPNVAGHVPPWRALESAVRVVQTKQQNITKPLLPEPDLTTGFSPYRKESEYSDEQLQRYLRAFFEVFLEEYKVLVETNFPTLKSFFELYSKLPTKFVVEIDKYRNSSNDRLKRGVKYAMIPKQPKNIVEVHINTGGNNPRIICDSINQKNIILSDEGTLEFEWRSGTEISLPHSTLSRFFGSHMNKVPIDSPGYHHDNKSASSETVIRNAVYKEVERDLKQVIRSIA